MRLPISRELLLILGGAAVLALVPLGLSNIYLLTLLFSIFTYAALAVGWNIIGGYTGYLSFGHAAFFGVGGYTTALLFANLGWSPFLTTPLGGVVAALVALVVGYPCLRLRGPYFALVTLILALAVRVVVLNVEWTGGSSGLFLKIPQMDALTNRILFYEAMLAVLLVSVLAAYWALRSKLGIGLITIREDEEVAQTLGINTTRLKMAAFLLSAFLAGMVGGIFSYYRTYVYPNIMFDLNLSVLVVLMALFGGRQNWLGPVVGALVISIVSEFLTLQLGNEAARILFGLLMVVVILYLPDGLLAYVRPRAKSKATGYGFQVTGSEQET
jgi:branched-chain amino acid transport system permease protein